MNGAYFRFKDALWGTSEIENSPAGRNAVGSYVSSLSDPQAARGESAHASCLNTTDPSTSTSVSTVKLHTRPGVRERSILKVVYKADFAGREWQARAHSITPLGVMVRFIRLPPAEADRAWATTGKAMMHR